MKYIKQILILSIVNIFLPCFLSAQEAGGGIVKNYQDQMQGLNSQKIIRKNPFLTKEEEASFAKEFINYMRLTGVFTSTAYSYAIIDGRIVKESDSIDNKKVTKINREEVILEDSYGKEYVVTMKGK